MVRVGVLCYVAEVIYRCPSGGERIEKPNFLTPYFSDAGKFWVKIEVANKIECQKYRVRNDCHWIERLQ